MRIFAVGDIVGEAGCDFVCSRLSGLASREAADFVMVNGENAAPHNGITPELFQRLRYAGADVVTTGNHAFRQKSSYGLFADSDFLLRPYNLPASCPGNGYTCLDTPVGRIGVLNLMGGCFLEGADNPFDAADRALEKMKDCDYIFVDFHAEATAEKKALGFYLDGRVTAIFGTHTHVRTADARTLPKGTGYITDIGMCGGYDSVLGVKPDGPIARFRTLQPAVYEQGGGEMCMDCAVFDTEKKTMTSFSVM